MLLVPHNAFGAREARRIMRTARTVTARLCAGAIVVSGGRLLLIRRGHAPSAGLWSVPGGHCEAGETSAAACMREAEEETGLRVRPVRLAGTVQRPGVGEVVLVIDDYVCELVGGALRAGDDAADVGWFSRSELGRLPLAPLLLETLDGWGVLTELAD